MPTITWLGEGDEGPQSTTAFGGIEFKVGEAVECKDEKFLARAAKNQYFKVEGWEAKEATVEVEKNVTVKPPSQQTAQYPVPKHGDVKTLTATVPNPPDEVPEADSAKTPGGVDYKPTLSIPPAKK